MNTKLSSRCVVHLVDDDRSLRIALSRLLRAAGYEVQAFASAGEFLITLTPETRGCLLLDVRMPGPNGLELHEALRRQNPLLAVVFLTAHGDIPMSVRAMKAGAADFLTKPVERKVLLKAVQSALNMETESHKLQEHLRVYQARFETLTPREREVFLLVADGKLNKEIAAELGMAERTVKTHRAQVMAKMHAVSLADLVRMAEYLHHRELPHEA